MKKIKEKLLIVIILIVSGLFIASAIDAEWNEGKNIKKVQKRIEMMELNF
jgi:hypothetical protein